MYASAESWMAVLSFARVTFNCFAAAVTKALALGPPPLPLPPPGPPHALAVAAPTASRATSERAARRAIFLVYLVMCLPLSLMAPSKRRRLRNPLGFDVSRRQR